MINIKKIIFLIFISFFSAEKINAEISDSIFMTIGNTPITNSDLVNEIKIILILNNQSYSEENRKTLHDLAVKSTVKRTIKEIELERNDYYQLNELDLQNELIRLATNIFVDLETLKNICESNELDFKKIEDQIKTELYWNSLIFEMYKARLIIDPMQIEEKLKMIQSKGETDEFLISELIVPYIADSKLKIEIEDLKKKITDSSFESVVREISASNSSINGGDLGWLNENEVSEKIKTVLSNTAVGSISKPIELPEGILLFLVRDKRKVKNKLTLEEVKDNLINNEKSKILNLHSLSHYDKVRRSISIKLYK